MTRFILIFVLSIVISRMFWRVVGSFKEGLSGRDPRMPRPPQQSVQMVRDPVCGTFLVPDRAVILVDGRSHVYFCSEACRDRYRARTA
jgi:YHS domain-containing protein